MADQIFLQGLRLFKKKANAPEYVIAEGVIYPDELNAFLIDNANLQTEYKGRNQLKIQIKLSREGNPYVAVDTWKPESATAPAPQQSLPSEPVEDIEKLPF